MSDPTDEELYSQGVSSPNDAKEVVGMQGVMNGPDVHVHYNFSVRSPNTDLALEIQRRIFQAMRSVVVSSKEKVM